ncbi:hypothetical protein D3C87_1367060 [compost metagenome]
MTDDFNKPIFDFHGDYQTDSRNLIYNQWITSDGQRILNKTNKEEIDIWERQ